MGSCGDVNYQTKSLPVSSVILASRAGPARNFPFRGGHAVKDAGWLFRSQRRQRMKADAMPFGLDSHEMLQRDRLLSLGRGEGVHGCRAQPIVQGGVSSVATFPVRSISSKNTCPASWSTQKRPAPLCRPMRGASREIRMKPGRLCPRGVRGAG